MCDPVTAIAGLAMAGGSGLQMMGQGQAQDAYSAAIEAENRRQEELAARARQVFQKSTGEAGADATKGEMQKEGADRISLGQKLTDSATEAMTRAVMAGAGSATKRSSQKVIGHVKGRTKQRNRHIADLNSFGDATGNIGRKLGRNKIDMGLIADKASGSLRVLPLELKQSQKKGAGLRALGDLLVQGGQIGLGGGFGKLGSMGGKAAGAAAQAGGKAGQIMIGGAPATASRGQGLLSIFG